MYRIPCFGPCNTDRVFPKALISMLKDVAWRPAVCSLATSACLVVAMQQMRQ